MWHRSVRNSAARRKERPRSRTPWTNTTSSSPFPSSKRYSPWSVRDADLTLALMVVEARWGIGLPSLLWTPVADRWLAAMGNGPGRSTVLRADAHELADGPAHDQGLVLGGQFSDHLGVREW